MGLQYLLGQCPGQRGGQQQRTKPIGLITVEHTGHLAIQHGQHQHGSQYHNCKSAQITLGSQTAAGKRQAGQPPQQRQAGKGAAVEQLGDGQAHIVGLHFGGGQVREHRLHAGDAEEEGKHGGGSTAHREAAAGHIVAGQIVVSTKIKRRTEPGGVVPHQSDGDQHHGQHKGNGLGDALLGEQALFPQVALPEDGQAEGSEQHHLRATASHEGHAQAAQREMKEDAAVLFGGLVGGQQPLPQRQHDEGSAGQDSVLIDRGAQQQIVNLAAGADACAEQQVDSSAHAREPAAGGLFDAAERRQQEQPAKQDHRQAGRQIPHAGQCLKGQLEQQARDDAKIDVVTALIVGNVPQGVRRSLLAGSGVVGVGHLLHGGGRVLLQVQAVVQQAVGQGTVLGGGIAGPIVDM